MDGLIGERACGAIAPSQHAVYLRNARAVTFGEGANVTDDAPARKKAVLKAAKEKRGNGLKKPSPLTPQARGKQSFVDAAMTRMPTTNEGEFLTLSGKGRSRLRRVSPSN